MNVQPSTSGRYGQRGLTLLELLVVVSILAVLATIAIQTTSDVGNQARYDATQTSLSRFRDAVLGPAGQTAPDGTPMVTGFISDMGRLPRSRALANPNYGYSYDLSELYSETLPAGLRAYSLYPATSVNLASSTYGGIISATLLQDSTLRVPAGWRGPYLRKPAGELSLVDGWGKPLISRFDMSPPSAGEINAWPTMLLAFRTNAAQQVYALPEDGAYTAVADGGREVAGVFTQSGFEGAPVGTDAYSGRFYAAVQANEYRVPLTVTVNCASTNTLGSANYVVLLMYGPNSEVATDTRPVRVIAQRAPYNATYNVTFTFDGVTVPAPTIGTKVFRAILSFGDTRYVYSRIVYFPVRPGVSSINIPLP